jgi:hypothetical protein
MAFPILGTPKPAFFDSSGDPLVSGTVTVQDPDDSSAKASYPTAADADAGTNGTTSAITLDSRGEPSSTQLWGKEGEDYKIILKDSSGSTVYTIDNIVLPISPTSGSTLKIKTANESLTNTTLAADTHLQGWSLKASSWYTVEGIFFVNAAGATQDFKIDWIFDNTPTIDRVVYVSYDGAVADTLSESDVGGFVSTFTYDVDGANPIALRCKGFINTTSSATTLDIHVAQGTDSGTTTLLAGSWVRVTPAST